MANALGNLFSDIAKAIRDKSGEGGSMKPMDFPAKIAAISTGSVEAGSVKMTRDFFKGNGGVVTVEHGLGEMPDIVVAYACYVPEGITPIMSMGFSQRLLDALGEGAYAPSTCFGPGGMANFSNSNGMHGAAYGVGDDFGVVRYVSSTTFQFGSTVEGICPTADGKTYGFVAIGGLI